MVRTSQELCYLLLEPSSGGELGQGCTFLWVCCCLCCMLDFGSKATAENQGKPPFLCPLMERSLRLAPPCPHLHMLATGNSIERMVGTQIASEGFRDGQPSLGCVAWSLQSSNGCVSHLVIIRWNGDKRQWDRSPSEGGLL